MMRSAAALGIACFALQVRGSPLDARLNPPSSIEPDGNAVTIHVRHTHRAVRACQPHTQHAEFQCSPTFEARNASTTLRLNPVRVRSLRGRVDERTPIDIHVTAQGTPETGAVLVQRGTWEILWSGAAPRRRFTADSGQTAAIELETMTGRCERAVKRCLLHPNEVSKRVDVAVY